MSDARWFEVDEDVAAAVKHFGMSADLFAAGGFDGDGIGAYRAQMALMHAMQSGHTSLESALVRILDLLGEEAPSGKDWHADLIKRVSRGIAGRPAILPPDLTRAAGGDKALPPCRHEGLRLVRHGAVAAVRAGRELRRAKHRPGYLLLQDRNRPGDETTGGGCRSPHSARSRPGRFRTACGNHRTKIAARSRRERAITRPRQSAGRPQPGRIRPRSGSPRR